MSIWSSIGPTPIPGLDYDDENGEPCLTVGVATTWHPVARLAIRGDYGTKAETQEATILLKPAELRELSARLLQAAEVCERR